MLPSTLAEAINLLNESTMIELAQHELRKRGKARLKARPPKQTLRLKLSDLTPEQRAKLSDMGLIK